MWLTETKSKLTHCNFPFPNQDKVIREFNQIKENFSYPETAARVLQSGMIQGILRLAKFIKINLIDFFMLKYL